MPVAAGPPVLASRGDPVVGWGRLEELDIGDQPGPGEDALEEIVTQQGVLGDASRQRRFEDVELIDPFAGVGTLPEEVLVDVGHRGGIWVDATRAGRQALIQGALTTRQRRRDARLQHRIPFDDATRAGVESRPIERMGHRADQPGRGSPRQPGIGIEGDDETNTRGDLARQERRVSGAAKKAIQLVEFAALALPPHPRALARVPHAPAMEEQESLGAPLRAMKPVETSDSLARGGERLLVPRLVLARRIRPVGEQREAKIAVRIRQIVHFQALDLLVHCSRVTQHRRHDDHRPQVRGHTVTQLEPWEDVRRDQCGGRTIQQRDCQVGCRHDGQEPEHEQGDQSRACCVGSKEGQRKDDRGEDHERSEIPGHRRRDIGAQQSTRRGCPDPQCQLEGQASIPDEVEAGILPPLIESALRVEHCRSSDLELGAARAPRELFDGVPVAVAGREVHGEVGRALSKRLVDEAHALEERGPVERGHQAHAHDHVSDGHVHRGLPLMLDPDDVIGCRTLHRQASVEPQQCRGDDGILVAQPLDELHGERRHQWGLLEPLEDRRWRLRRAVESEEVVGQQIGLLARRSPADDRLG